jgi:predicted dehydrogenase
MKVEMTEVAVVGLGYWGPNLVRNIASLKGVHVKMLCDADAARAEAIRARLCHDAVVVQDYREVAADPKVEAVVIATPIRSHFKLGSFFLKAGKHVFIEKPLARTVAECERLIKLAEQHRRVLMVGHVFEYNAAVRWIKNYMADGELGKLFYMYSQRVNLGRIQTDVNALWSFAPHDVSVMNYWLGREPVSVAARGFSYLKEGVEDVIFVTLNYPEGVSAHLHLGWLDPRKVRLMTLVGSKKMLVYDDVSLDAKIQIYDRGIVDLHDYLESPSSFVEFQFQIRMGNVTFPTLKFDEPLQTECQHFIECVRTGERPITDGADGLKVVRVLEAAQLSLVNGGQTVLLEAGA